MGLRLILFITVFSLITACTKSSAPETADDSHQIVVSIADSKIDTKCTVNIVGERGKTSFSPGDELMVISSNDVKGIQQGTYKYKYKQSAEGGEKSVFQKNIEETIDTNNIVAAFYPASWFQGYTFKSKTNKKYVTVKFPEEQSYAQQNENQTISAPMVCFTPNDSKLTFSNLSCLLRIGIQCESEPVSEIFVSHINVISDLENSLDGNVTFGSDESVSVSLGDYDVSLIDCENAGALSLEVKYFYIILPPIFNYNWFEDGDKFTVDVIFVGGKSKSYTFTATEGGDNPITKNTILDFPPITINPADVL